jgi:hypothetical protein
MYKRTAKLEYSQLLSCNGLAYMPENFLKTSHTLTHAHTNPLMDNDQPNVQYPAAAGEPAEIRDEAMPPEVLVENNAHAVPQPQPPAQDQGELAV